MKILPHEAYWYARGYHDGRGKGFMKGFSESCPDDIRLAYKQGYDCGVRDYCDMDEGKDIDYLRKEEL